MVEVVELNVRDYIFKTIGVVDESGVIKNATRIP